jgi:GTP-binding protein
MLIDQAVIFVRSGKGGAGCVSFRREKYVPKGGPDGGDGGDGGDVILRGDASLSTLLPLTPRPHYRAKNGLPGMGKQMHGADGADRIVPVPLGTLVYDDETDELLIDISEEGQEYIAAAGGRGGLGNEHFKSAINQTPREATPGEPWVERTLRLELKLIADVGLIGKPNAGKSTLLRAISRANPKVADYPFTTLSPHLGVAELPKNRRLMVADIPGLIEGAAEGAGLGHEFLRHVERTAVLLHVLDAAPMDGTDPVDNYEAIRQELFEYSAELAEKRELIAINKIDLLDDEERESVVTRLMGRLGLTEDERPMLISGATGEHTREALERCWGLLDREKAAGWTKTRKVEE